MADAYVFVLPEYNSGTTPALMNAFNYVYKEWNYKPAAFVSYGGESSGGVRAVQFTKQIMNTLKLVPIVEGVIIPMVAQQLDEARRFKPTESHLNSAKAMLDELLRWAEALKPMRDGVSRRRTAASRAGARRTSGRSPRPALRQGWPRSRMSRTSATPELAMSIWW